MLSQGFKQSNFDHCLYTNKGTYGILIILILYVDDMLIVSEHRDDVTTLTSKLHANFDMKDLGDASHILGMRI